MTELFYWILNRSISASVLILAVLLLRLLFRKAPKWVNVLLWGLVAVRLVCPVALSTPFSLMPKADWLSQEPAYSQEDPAPVSPDRIPQTPSAGTDGTVHRDPVEPQVQIRRGVSVPFLLSCIWLAGIGAMLTYMLVSYIRVVRHIRKANRFRDNIYLSDGVSSPFVFGLVRPRIYLPEKMDAVSMSYVISHEEAHLRRLDHLWKPLGFLLLSVHWFNPLIWLGYLLLCRDIEMACDEYVVRRMNEAERVEYSEALLECSVNRRTVSACPLAFGEVGVKERIKSVLNYKKPAFWIVVLAVTACVAAAVCFLTDPIRKDKPNNHGEDSSIWDGTPSLTVSYDSFFIEMAQMEENEAFPADNYTINVTGLSVPVKLFMHVDCVAAIEAHGYYVELQVPRDTYGNCNVELFEADGSIIFEGGHYNIGDVYILSSEKHSEIHPGKGYSYWLRKDEGGALKYSYTHNSIASMIQTGALSCAVSYDELLYAEGDASIENGEVIFAEPTESYTVSDQFDLDEEFQRLWSNSYASIEEIFAANRSAGENTQPNHESAERVKGWFTGTDIDWTLAYTHADWMDLSGHFTDKTVTQTANLVLYQEVWYLVLETPGQAPRIEKTALTVPTAKGYLLAHDLTGDGLDELLCVFSVLGSGGTYSVYGYQLSDGGITPILVLLDGWDQDLGIEEIDQNALGFVPFFLENYQMTWKNRFVDKSYTFGLSAMGNVSEWFDAHGVGKPDHLFTDIGQELRFADSNGDGIDELVCGGPFSYGGHLYTVGRLSASLQYNPQTRGFEVVDVSYRSEDGTVPDDSPDDTVHGEWNYKFSDETGPQFYGLTFDTGNQEMKFEYGYYESEYVNRYFGSYTLDPVSQVITATLHDSSIVHTDPDITLKFQLEYSTGENVLVWDILSCDVGKYQHLIGNPLAFKKGNPLN